MYFMCVCLVLIQHFRLQHLNKSIVSYATLDIQWFDSHWTASKAALWLQVAKGLEGCSTKNVLIWQHYGMNLTVRATEPVCSPGETGIGRCCPTHAASPPSHCDDAVTTWHIKNAVAVECFCLWRKFTDLSKPVFNEITVYRNPHDFNWHIFVPLYFRFVHVALVRYFCADLSNPVV